MEHLERPDSLTWDERQLWFQERQYAYAQSGIGQASEQALALLVDLEAIYCVGAFASVVLLCGVIVESQMHITKHRSALPPKDWEWLRTSRNRLAHEKVSKPALTIEDQWLARDIWENRARKAINLTFVALYGPLES